MNLVEDQKEGMVEYPETPDVKAAIEGLKQQGFTSEQILSAMEGLPINKEVKGQIEANTSPSETIFEGIEQEEVFTGIDESQDKAMPSVIPEAMLGYQETDLVQGFDFGGTDLLDTPQPVELSLPELKEDIFIAADLIGDTSPEALQTELETVFNEGYSPLVASSIAPMQQITDYVSQEILMRNMGEDPVANAEKLQEYNTVQQNKPDSNRARLLEGLYSKLPTNRVVPDDVFSFLGGQVKNLNSMSRAAQILAQPLENKAKLLEDIGELFIPIYGEVLYLDYQDALSEGNYDRAMGLLVGNHNLDRVAEEYFSKGPEEQSEYLRNVLESVANFVPRAATGDENNILALELVSKIYDKILEGPKGVEEFTSTDALAVAETALAELAIVFPVVQVIKDTVRLSRLSRIRRVPFQDTIDRLQPPRPDVKEGEWFSKDDPIYPNNGTGDALDIYLEKDPDGFIAKLENTELEQQTRGMGTDDADMPRRMLPRLSEDPDNMNQPSGVSHHTLSPSLQRKIDNNHMAIQLQEKEVEGLLPSFVHTIASELGDTAVPHLDKSYFEALDDPSGSSLGSFVVRLGDGPTRGFGTPEDAQRVASRLYGDNAVVVRRSPYGDFSKDFQNLPDSYGEYFVELRQEHQFTPTQGLGTFIGDEGLVTGGSMKPVLNFFFDDDMLFNTRISKTYSVIRDRANAFGVELSIKAQPLMDIANHPSDVKDFNIAASLLQAEGRDDIDVTHLTHILGHKPHPRTVKALEAARDINLANWRIKNNQEYSVLKQERYKTALIGDNRYIGKPLIERPEKLSGRKIYDPSLRQTVDNSGEVLDSIYDQGGIIYELYKPVKFEGAEYTRIVVRNPMEEIKELQTDVVPFVRGHVQRIYKDDGFIVTGNVNKIVDGESRIATIGLGITSTLSEAKKLLVDLELRGARVNRGERAIVPTGEYIRDKGLKTTGAFSLEESISRGEILKGYHGSTFGDAEVLDPYAAYVKALHMTRQKFEQPVQQLNKQRWVERYKGILNTPVFPATLNRGDRARIFKDVSPDNIKYINEAENFHRRISIAEGGDLERMNNWVTSKLRDFEMALDAEGSTSLAKSIKGVNPAKAQTLASGYASLRWIWGNPIYQMTSVVAQTPFLLSQGPFTVAKSIQELAFQAIPLVLAKGTKEEGFWSTLVSMERGISKERAIHEMQTILDSGIVRTADVAQDYATDVHIFKQTLLENPTTRGVTVATLKGLSVPIRGLKGAVLGSIDLFELLTFIIAKNKWQQTHPNEDWTKAKNVDTITFAARSLSLNQNDTARFSYQNSDSLVRLFMALTSFTNRMAVRMYLDPLVGGMLSKALKPKGSAKSNMYTATLAGSVGTTLVGIGMFGSGYFDPLDLDFEESQKEYLRALANRDYRKLMDPQTREMFKNMGLENPSQFVLESWYMGLHQSITNSMFEGDSNFVEKFHTAGYIKMMYDKFANMSTDTLMETAFGLPYTAVAGSMKVISHMAKMAMATEDLDTEDGIYLGLELLSQIKVVDDAVAAYMAINLGRRVTKSTLSAKEKTTMFEQLSKLAGGIPQSEFMAQVNSEPSDFAGISSDDYMTFMLRKTQFELYNKRIETQRDLTESEVSEIMVKNLQTLMSGDSDYNTRERKEEFKRRVNVVGKPFEYNGFFVDTETQEQGIQALHDALKEEEPSEWRAKIEERIGLLELQLNANPRETSIRNEMEVLRGLLLEIYDKDPEELNEELLESHL